jgi:hypothetical protein
LRFSQTASERESASELVKCLPLLLQSDSQRFEEYPRLKLLVEAKDVLVKRTATPPYFLKAVLPSMGSR